MGVRDIAHLQALDAQDAAQNPPLRHVTRHRPKRGAELLDGGSIYWVIGGAILVRQKLIDIRPETAGDGTLCTALVLDQDLVRVEAKPMRAFQGWRYLDPKDAPPDLTEGGSGAEMPEGLRRQLAALGLL